MVKHAPKTESRMGWTLAVIGSTLREVTMMCSLRRQCWFNVAFGLCVFWLATPSLCAQHARKLVLEGKLQTSTIWTVLPRWNGGLLVGVEERNSSAPIVYTIDRDGRRDELLLTIPNAALITIFDLNVTPDGQIALVGQAYSDDPRSATFVARISADRKVQTVTRAWPFAPQVVTIAADNTLWALGPLMDEDNTRVVADTVLRRFDVSGALLTSKELPVALAGHHSADMSFLASSKDRVGWYRHDGDYLEFALDGTATTRVQGPADVSGFALSEDNEAVAGNFSRKNAEFVVLDRRSGTWRPVTNSKEYAPTWAWVLGFDGSTLVATTRNGELTRFMIE